MRKMTKLGIDELRKEFPVMTAFMQSQTLGGNGNTCAIDAAIYASARLGLDITSDQIWDTAAQIVVEAGDADTILIGRGHIRIHGLTSSQATELYSRVFGVCGSGDSYEPYAVSVSIVSYTVKDAVTGQPLQSGGMDVTHAGIIIDTRTRMDDNGKEVEEMLVQTNSGTWWVPCDDKRMEFLAKYVDPNCGAFDECGSGDGGYNGGDGSGSGF